MDDIQADLPVTPWEAALGAKVRVPTLGGAVDIEMKVPPGSQAGQRLRAATRTSGSTSSIHRT